MNEDPKKVTKTKMTDEEFEAFYSELYAEFGPGRKDGDTTAQSPANKNVRNHADGYGTTNQPRQNAPRKYQGSNAAAYGGNLDERRAVSAPQPKKKEKGVKGLVICACVETLAIVAVVMWWVLRIL